MEIMELGGKANMERRIDGCCDFQKANIQGLKKVSQTCGSGNKQTKIRGKRKKKQKQCQPLSPKVLQEYSIILLYHC